MTVLANTTCAMFLCGLKAKNDFFAHFKGLLQSKERKRKKKERIQKAKTEKEKDRNHL